VLPTFDITHARDWIYVMGIDIGYNDPSAYVVVACSRLKGLAVVVDSFEQSEMTASEALAEAERLCAKYPVCQIAVDTGGGGAKMIMKDWQKLTRLPVRAANKTHKASQVSIINSDFRNGKIKVARDNNMKFINDLMILEWDAQKKDRNKFEYPRGAPDHLADAFQYAYNLCFHHYREIEPEPRPKPGTPEYWALEEDLMEQQQSKECDEQDGNPWTILEQTYLEGL
jgi:hypothetical protein